MIEELPDLSPKNEFQALLGLGFTIEYWRGFRSMTERHSLGRRFLVKKAWEARKERNRLLGAIHQGKQ